MRVPTRIGSSVVMNMPPRLMLAMLRRTRDGPLLLLVNSNSTCAVIGARSNRRRSSCAELFIILLCCALWVFVVMDTVFELDWQTTKSGSCTCGHGSRCHDLDTSNPRPAKRTIPQMHTGRLRRRRGGEG